MTRAQAGSLARAIRELDWKALPGGDVTCDLLHEDTGTSVTITITGRLPVEPKPAIGFRWGGRS